MTDIDVSAMMKDFNNKRSKTSTVAVNKDAEKEKELASQVTEKTGVEVTTGHDIVNEKSLEEELAASIQATTAEENLDPSDEQAESSVVTEDESAEAVEDESAEVADGVEEDATQVTDAEPQESETPDDNSENEEPEHTTTDESDVDSIVAYCKENAMDIINECRDEVHGLVEQKMKAEGLEYNAEYTDTLISIFGEVAKKVLKQKLDELVENADDTGKVDVISTILSYTE